MTYEPSDKIGALTEDELAVFLAEPWNGRIATVTAEGWPYVAPVWYEFERDRRAFLAFGQRDAVDADLDLDDVLHAILDAVVEFGFLDLP